MVQIVNLWAVVGDGGSGKSSTIRALTGAYQTTVYNVAASYGRLQNMLIVPKSLQESGISPGDFVARVSGDYPVTDKGPIRPDEARILAHYAYQNVLVALRDAGHNNQPDADAYLDAFVTARWQIQAPLIYLTSTGTPAALAPAKTFHPPFVTLPVTGGGSTPANQKASTARAAWGWV